jgi:hypothetical protein
MKIGRVMFLALLAVGGVDCQSDRAEPAPQTATTAPAAQQQQNDPQPAAAQQTFEDKKLGIRFKYPQSWQPEKAQTAAFDVAAPADNKGYSSLSLDVPHLPPHIPGMITPRMVTDGYVDDLRKHEIHDAKVDEAVDLKCAGAPARRVKCSGHENGKAMTDVAVAIIHNDRVYIFSCDGDPDGYNAARAALDAAVASIEWIK